MAVQTPALATMTPMPPMMTVAVNMLLGAVTAVEALMEATVTAITIASALGIFNVTIISGGVRNIDARACVGTTRHSLIPISRSVY